MDAERRLTRRLQAMHALCGQEMVVGGGLPELQMHDNANAVAACAGDAQSSALRLLWPLDGQCVLVYKTTAWDRQPSRVLVQVHGMHPWWAVARPEFALPSETPPASMFVGVLYTEKTGRGRVGVFDCILYDGNSQIGHESALQRHTLVAGLFHKSSASSGICHHWAGDGSTCEKLLLAGTNDTLPFEALQTTPLPVDGSKWGQGWGSAWTVS